MRKKVITLAIAASIALMSGCYGPFVLTKKVYQWNGTMGDKYVKSIIFWVLNIVPVYEAAAFIDAVALNTIEFWTGSNPMAIRNAEKTEKIVVSGDKTYRVLAGNDEINIRQTSGPGAGQEMTLVYEEPSQSWMLKQADGQMTTLAALDLSGNPSARLFYPDGRVEVKEIK